MDLIDVFERAGALGLALFLLWWFVNDRIHSDKAMKRERENTERERRRGDRLEEMLISALQMSDRSVKLAEHKIYEFDHDKTETSEESP